MISGEELIGSFDPENIRMETLLFQSEYLTIKKWSTDPIRGSSYVLGYPNAEVRISINLLFSEVLSGGDISSNRSRLYELLNDGDIDGLRDLFHALFESIPYDWYRKNQISKFEGYYASVIYSNFASLGYQVIPEDTTNKGRVDLTVIVKNLILLFEFKVRGIDKRDDISPLEQIRKKVCKKVYW